MSNPASVKRGDVVLVPFPNSDLRTFKLRPALVVQSDTIDSEIPQVVVAMITSNLNPSGRAPRFEVQSGPKAGLATGLLVDSVEMTDNLATLLKSQIARVIGKLEEMTAVDHALRHTLSL